MRVLIGDQRRPVSPKRLLGEGGEASVFLHVDRSGSLAIKIFKSRAAHRVPKLEALAKLGPAIAKWATLPRDLVRDAQSGEVVGYAMPALAPELEPFAMLSRASFRARAGADLSTVLRLFGRLGQALWDLHERGVVVGDLNDQNELLACPNLAVALIDCDSFQLAGLPCEVSTEIFLDPLLYGPDPAQPCATASGEPRWFGRGSDWYAFSVLAFRSLTGLHPYGGSTRDGATMAVRAAAARSVLDPDVVVPPLAASRVAALAEPLREHFARVFQGRERRPPDLDLLEHAAQGARSCSCGLELCGGVSSCPRCTRLSSSAGRELSVTALAQVPGLVAAWRVSGPNAVLVTRERERYLAVSPAESSGVPAFSRVIERAAPGARLSLRGPLLLVAWCVEGGAAVRVEHWRTGAVLLETECEVAFGSPAAALDDGGLWRVARGTLIRTRVSSSGAVLDEHATRAVVSEHTVLSRDGDALCAVSQVLGRRDYLLLERERVTDLEVPGLERGERLEEDAVYGSAGRILVAQRTTLAGCSHVRWTVHSQSQAVVRHTLSGAVPPHGVSIRRGVWNGRELLVASDLGLLRVDPSGARPHRVFQETEPFVTASSELEATERGVAVLTGGALRLLERAPP